MTTAPTFGYVLPPSTGTDVPEPEQLWELIDLAEASSLSHLWVSDHILWWHPMHDALSMLAAIAGRTQRIGIGPAVMLLAMREPVLAAKALATIQRLSSGRLTLGVGVGGEFPPEWEATGTPLRTRASRTDEMIAALRGLWGLAPFSMDGRHVKLDQVDLHPKPRQRPPIWIGGRSKPAIERAARLGDGWMGIFLTPERYRERLDSLKALRERAGLGADGFTPSLYAWTCIADTDAEAKRIASGILGAFYNLEYDKLERFAVVGSAETCARRFAEFADAGVEHFAVAPIAVEPSNDPLLRLINDVLPSL